jgi:hypothetical protein
MSTEIRLLLTVITALLGRSPRPSRGRRRRHRGEDGGYTTESVIVTAVLAATALTVLGIIAVKVIEKARSIGLG